ncbi:high choriolytic enzyme 1-like [Anguilla anguilla]|uniref:high choriolytic enzyme 1-like n=1 Tax=Anguilla anguilla TaxID=7936 RepID=UPI0015B2A088|nr:high choriolytic enzyme 1-like [Anguilla anguilla]
MDQRLISTILALLLSLSQAHPLVDLGSEADDSPLISIQIDDPDDVDITTMILQSNNGSSEMLMEGDMVVSNTRNAMKCWNNQCLWRKSSDGLVEVPYTVSNEFPYYQKKRIENAMKTFNTETCIRFVPRSSQRDFISIESRDGCYSYLGRTGGKQVVSLARYGCVYHGIIQHELNHALGFYHEHTRSDRDEYVKINWENVAPHTIYNFQTQDTNNLNTPYDYTSIMHYGRTAFSTNGMDTITPVPNPNKSIGQRRSMSMGDILRINKLYSCCEREKLEDYRFLTARVEC